MSFDQYLLTALSIGLLGSVHCVGMCGGIVGALTLSTVQQPGQSNRLLLFLFAYNAGRITSYTVAGFIAGVVGSTLIDAVDKQTAFLVTRIVTGVFLLALGLFLAGWTQFLLPLESIGLRLWKYIQPLGKKFIPITSLPHAYYAGLVWGWLPCGLVYSALIWALASGNGVTGAATMFTFGLATLPALFLSGLSAVKFSKLTKSVLIRRLVGALLVGLGIVQLSGIWATHVHSH